MIKSIEDIKEERKKEEKRTKSMWDKKERNRKK